MSTQYILIIGRAWCNDKGSGIWYESGCDLHDNRDDAILEGWANTSSDDFNIGVVTDGKLVSLDWMSDVVESDPYKLGRIAEQIELEVIK